MEPNLLHRELQARGLVVLAVCQHRANPEVLVAHLHGNAGQWVHGMAMETIREVPGVLAVVESVQTPAILLVQVQPTSP